MKLFTKAIERKMARGNRTSVCKIFNPYGNQTWIIFGEDDVRDPDILFAVVDLGMGYIEAGSVSRSELESIRVTKFGWPLERDMHYSGGQTVEELRGLTTLVGV
jgi:hypothetical protein